MTSTDVPGFTDVNHRVAIHDGDNIIQRVSLRYCLLSLLKLKDKSPLIAEVHQLAPGDSLQIVHPNIPEAEALLTNMQKHEPASCIMTSSMLVSTKDLSRLCFASL